MVEPLVEESARHICSVLEVKEGLKSSFNLGKMFSLDIILTNLLDFTKTIIPLALLASQSIAHSALDSWTIDSEPIRARRVIVKYPAY